MKRILSVICCLGLTSCSAFPVPMEMGDMVFVRTLGVDAEEESLALTASTGVRGQGLSPEAEASLTLTGSGTSLSAGAKEVAAGCNRQVFYGYLDQLLLGEDYCTKGILPALEYFARDVELGLGTEVWAVEGTAEEAIRGGGEQGVTDRLSTLQMEELQGTAMLTTTAGQLLTDILEDGATYLPRLTSGTEEETALRSAGYTIIIGDTQCGVLTGTAARGLELLEGEPSGEVFQGASGAVVEIFGADCHMRPVMAGDVLAGAHIYCDLNVRLVEYDRLPDGQEMDQLATQLAHRQEETIAQTMKELQTMGADAIGLGRQLGMEQPALWAEWEAYWGERFSRLPIWITVDVTVERSTR